MSYFDILLIGHLVGDYLFQTNWMAMNKTKKWDALVVHSFVYTCCVFLASWIGFGGLTLIDVLIIFVTHLIIDRRTIVIWWVENIMRTDVKAVGWLTVIVDQIFHLIIIVVVLFV